MDEQALNDEERYPHTTPAHSPSAVLNRKPIPFPLYQGRTYHVCRARRSLAVVESDRRERRAG